MIPLTTQEQFEAIWNNSDPTTAKPVLIWFSAAWCAPCQRMDKAALEDAAARAGLDFYYCDETVNQYTSGYCGIKSLPTFLAFQPPKRILSRISNSNTETVCKWIATLNTEKKYD